MARRYDVDFDNDEYSVDVDIKVDEFLAEIDMRKPNRGRRRKAAWRKVEDLAEKKRLRRNLSDFYDEY